VTPLTQRAPRVRRRDSSLIVLVEQRSGSRESGRVMGFRKLRDERGKCIPVFGLCLAVLAKLEGDENLARRHVERRPCGREKCGTTRCTKR
jgi:hypothetical protein